MCWCWLMRSQVVTKHSWAALCFGDRNTDKIQNQTFTRYFAAVDNVAFIFHFNRAGSVTGVPLVSSASCKLQISNLKYFLLVSNMIDETLEECTVVELYVTDCSFKQRTNYPINENFAKPTNKSNRSIRACANRCCMMQYFKWIYCPSK